MIRLSSRDDPWYDGLPGKIYRNPSSGEGFRQSKFLYFPHSEDLFIAPRVSGQDVSDNLREQLSTRFWVPEHADIATRLPEEFYDFNPITGFIDNPYVRYYLPNPESEQYMPLLQERMRMFGPDLKHIVDKFWEKWGA